jgi:tetratricopeptide (TPR) repeat protein
METLATSAQSPEAVLLRASTLCLVAAELYWEEGARHRKLALDLLKRAQTRHPDDFWINLTLSGYSSPNLINWSGVSRQRQSIAGMPYCMAAVALRPESFWPRLQLADMLSESGQTEAALAEYNKAIELRPNHAVAHNNLGYNGYYRQQQYDKAIAEYQKAIKLRPDFGLAYNNLGIALAAEKKFAEAAASFNAAIKCEPNSATSYTNLGSALRYLGQLDDSVKAHLKATILDPKLGAAWNNLGYTYFAQGKFGEAVAAYHRAIELVPENNLAHSNLGAALAAQKHFDEAVSEYHKAIELLPDPGDINTLAWLLSTCAELRIRDPVRALELARVAVEKAPLEGDCRLTLGVAQYRAGKWQDAIASLTKAEELAPEANLAFKGYFLAMAHWQLGHKEEARKWYGRSVAWMDKNQPTNDELIRFRAEAENVLGITRPSPTEKNAPQADAAPKPKATN